MRNLFDFLNPKHVDVVIGDEYLKLNGKTTFHYVVDPLEIRKYCFPHGLDEFDYQDDEKSELLNQQINALQYIFYERINKPIIANEYIEEFNNFKSYVVHISDSHHAKKKVLEIDKLATSNSNDDHFRLFLTLNSSNFNHTLATVVGEMGRGLDALNKLNQRLLKFNHEIDDDDDDELIKTVFENTDYSNNVDLIYNELMKFSYVNSFTRNDDQIHTEHKRYGIRKMRDAKVLDRIISINNTLEELFLNEQLRNRHVVVYLSSATTGSSAFYKSNKLLSIFPVINGESFNIFRSTAQTFCYIVNKDKDPFNAIKKLSEMRLLVEDLNKARAQKNSNKDSAFSEVLAERMGYAIRKLSDNALFLQMKIYHSLLEESFLSGDMNKLREICKELEESAKKHEPIAERARLNILLETRFESHAFRIFSKAKIDLERMSITDSSFKYKSTYGRDGVSARYHTLPFQIKIIHTAVYDKFISDLFLGLFRAIEEMDLGTFINKLNIALDFLKNRRIEFENTESQEDDKVGYFYDKIIVGILLLALPSIDKVESYTYSTDIDLLVYEYFDNLLPFIIRDPKLNEVFYKEYIYIMLWAIRRAGNSKEGGIPAVINVAENNFHNDHRIQHGLALWHYSVYYRKGRTFNDDPAAIDSLLQAIKYAESAFKLYNNRNNALNEIELKAFSALTNTLLYLKLLIAYLTKQYNRSAELKELRAEYLSRIKEIEAARYGQIPEFLHTEAFLELMEHLADKLNSKEVKRDFGVSKIYHSYLVIRKAIELKDPISFDINQYFDLSEIVFAEYDITLGNR